MHNVSTFFEGILSCGTLRRLVVLMSSFVSLNHCLWALCLSLFFQAVSARLANPEMSLYDALIAGGFHYASPDDSTAADHEGVTLGQRKNQLSRRLRMARRQGPDGIMETLTDANSSTDGVNVNATGSAAGLSTNAQHDLHQLMQQQRAASRHEGSSNKLAARALQMKQEQQGIGELSDDDMDGAEDQTNKKPRIAKFHPDFAPILVPLHSAVRVGATPKLGLDTTASNRVQQPTIDGNSGMSSSIMAAHSSLFASPFALQHNASRPSAVAISSLTHSAQAVGLTLEQLAISLAADSTTIAKILAENSSNDASTKRMKLALRLFEMDVKTLYSTSMLRAGFDPRECQLNTPSFQDFAQKAWEREAARLKSSGMTWDLSLADLEKQPGLSEDSDDEHSHSHGHTSHDGGTKCAAVDCDSRHVHRIDGQCGHKAIIHKPKDGYAHIDFVVGDKVECYHGIEPFGKNGDTAWPSRYRCREAGAHGHCGSERFKDLSDEVPIPKIIELSTINLQDPEWNYDMSGSIDGGVAGLFRLSEKTEDATANV
jgi:hypothetical protein